VSIRIGGAVVQVGACSRTEHWLPLTGKHGEALHGRGGKPAMLHVYLSYLSIALSSSVSASSAARTATHSNDSTKYANTHSSNGSGGGQGHVAHENGSSAIHNSHASNLKPVPSRQSGSHDMAGVERARGGGAGGGGGEGGGWGGEVSRANCRIGEQLWVRACLSPTNPAFRHVC